MSQVRLPNETHSDALITPERRMTWKVAVMSTSLNLFSHYTYCEKPIATNKQSQLRFNEIGLDINRTFPQNKSLNRKDL